MCALYIWDVMPEVQEAFFDKVNMTFHQCPWILSILYLS